MEKVKTKKFEYVNEKKSVIDFKKAKRGTVPYGEIIKQYNSLVDETNAMVRDYNKLVDNYNKVSRAHNMLLDHYKTCEDNNKAMKKLLDAQKADVDCLKKITTLIKKKNIPTRNNS